MKRNLLVGAFLLMLGVGFLIGSVRQKKVTADPAPANNPPAHTLYRVSECVNLGSSGSDMERGNTCIVEADGQRFLVVIGGTATPIETKTAIASK